MEIKLDKLKELYVTALNDGKKTFKIGEIELMTGYAKYLIIFAEDELGKRLNRFTDKAEREHFRRKFTIHLQQNIGAK